MNNGEKIRAMNNVELAIELAEHSADPLARSFTKEERIAQKFAYLEMEALTTADEDFAEIGFIPHNAGVTKAVWFQRECRDYVAIYKTTINWDGIFTDEEIDQIRTIADKKRKEVWGNIHDKEVE